MFNFGDRDRSYVDPESEVLGCMMLLPNCCDSVFAIISERHFSKALHQTLFLHIQRVYVSTGNFDMLALRDSLVELGEYGIDCNATEIARIFTSVSFATPEHAAKHAKILLDKNR